MLDNIITWNSAVIIVATVLVIHVGIKTINRFFDGNNKKKNSSIF